MLPHPHERSGGRGDASTHTQRPFHAPSDETGHSLHVWCGRAPRRCRRTCSACRTSSPAATTRPSAAPVRAATTALCTSAWSQRPLFAREPRTGARAHAKPHDGDPGSHTVRTPHGYRLRAVARAVLRYAKKWGIPGESCSNYMACRAAEVKSGGKACPQPARGAADERVARPTLPPRSWRLPSQEHAGEESASRPAPSHTPRHRRHAHADARAHAF